MTNPIVIFLGIALVATVFALAREIRLRKALEQLICIILSRWRAHVSQNETKDSTPVDRNPDPDKRV
jgi:hypothetical protein